ncbi:MAG: multi-sensor signal transduction histidine kinase [Verrucomicrobiales bacterium]|nr:multi-sensor signal transduction histidine kinase [Verrucomicrobiales bacterium]
MLVANGSGKGRDTRFMSSKMSRSARYALAVAIIGVATMLRMVLSRSIGPDFPFATYYIGVTVAVWVCGTAPSIMACLLGYIGAEYFFYGGPAIAADPVAVLMYFAVTFAIIGVGRSMLHAKRRIDASMAEAKRRNHECEQEIGRRQRVEQELDAAKQTLADYTHTLEEQVAERTEKLTQTVKSLEGFCYSIAHDLRTPIRAMQGYAIVLAEECALNAPAKEYTRKISDSACRMDQLVQDLLAYGRLTHEPVALSAVDVESVLDQLLSHMQDETHDAQVSVLRPLPKVLAQPTILTQALGNLIRNALKFVKPGTMPNIYIRAEELPYSIRICIDDNGIGIDQQYHDKIFNVFERLHHPEEYPGTGIGLAIVKKGVERLGGRVGLNSMPGKGSCFWIELEKAGAAVGKVVNGATNKMLSQAS